MSGSNEHSGSAPGEYDERGPGGGNGLRVIGCGQTAVARRGDLLDGRLQTRHRATEQRKCLKAQRKLADGPCLAHGVVVSGVRSAPVLFATEAQGNAYQDETREEGGPHGARPASGPAHDSRHPRTRGSRGRGGGGGGLGCVCARIGPRARKPGLRGRAGRGGAGGRRRGSAGREGTIADAPAGLPLGWPWEGQPCSSNAAASRRRRSRVPTRSPQNSSTTFRRTTPRYGGDVRWRAGPGGLVTAYLVVTGFCRLLSPFVRS
jgi:hypothetical protein